MKTIITLAILLAAAPAFAQDDYLARQRMDDMQRQIDAQRDQQRMQDMQRSLDASREQEAQERQRQDEAFRRALTPPPHCQPMGAAQMCW